MGATAASKSLSFPGPRSGWQADAPAIGLAAVYRRREPTATALYPIVQHHLESFLVVAADTDSPGQGFPAWVEDDFRAYLRCGILAHGFARARCGECAAPSA